MKKINDADKEFILANLELDDKLKLELDDSDNISDDIADELRELCIEHIDYCGYDENYNLTEKGKALNSLIDKLFVE